MRRTDPRLAYRFGLTVMASWGPANAGQSGPVSGPPSDASERLAGMIPDEHSVSRNLLLWLIEFARPSEHEAWTQTIAIQTPQGWVVVTVEPVGLQVEPVRCAQPVLSVVARSLAPDGRATPLKVPFRNDSLVRDIARALPAGFKDPGYVGRYLDLAILAAPGADLHTICLSGIPPHHLPQLGLVAGTLRRVPVLRA